MQHGNPTTERNDHKAFAWRRMKPWQIWTLAGAVVVFIAIALMVA